jgi:hypothetical protein
MLFQVITSVPNNDKLWVTGKCKQHSKIHDFKRKGKAVPVTGREGP